MKILVEIEIYLLYALYMMTNAINTESVVAAIRTSQSFLSAKGVAVAMNLETTSENLQAIDHAASCANNLVYLGALGPKFWGIK